MKSYNTYPNLPSALPPQSEVQGPKNPQAGYHLNMVQAKGQGLIDKKMFKKNTRSTIRY